MEMLDECDDIDVSTTPPVYGLYIDRNFTLPSQFLLRFPGCGIALSSKRWDCDASEVAIALSQGRIFLESLITHTLRPFSTWTDTL